MSDSQIFQLLGFVYLAAGLGLILNPGFYRALMDEFAVSPSRMYLSGIAVLAIGYVLIAVHNFWAWEWPVLITLIGWIGFIEGFIMVAFPDVMIKIINIFQRNDVLLKAEAWIALVLSGLFLYLGFMTGF